MQWVIIVHYIANKEWFGIFRRTEEMYLCLVCGAAPYDDNVSQSVTHPNLNPDKYICQALASLPMNCVFTASRRWLPLILVTLDFPSLIIRLKHISYISQICCEYSWHLKCWCFWLVFLWIIYTTSSGGHWFPLWEPFQQYRNHFKCFAVWQWIFIDWTNLLQIVYSFTHSDCTHRFVATRINFRTRGGHAILLTLKTKYIVCHLTPLQV